MLNLTAPKLTAAQEKKMSSYLKKIGRGQGKRKTPDLKPKQGEKNEI